MRGGNSQVDGEEILDFDSRKAWRHWLQGNHEASKGVWMRIAKAKSGLVSVTYPEAIEVALCYGWIDGLKRPESERAWLQRWTPRKPKSLWSKINRDKALRLIESGEMMPPGLREIERAKADGRWDSAYDTMTSITVPPDLAKALSASSAGEFFAGLDRINRYAILWRLQTAAKPETRAKRLAKFIDMLEKGQRIHDTQKPPDQSR